MKVALLCNMRGEGATGSGPDDWFEEFDSPETIAAISGALKALGLQVEPVEADRRLPWRLDEGNYDIAFNIAEGVGRRCREAIPAAVCEMLGLPFTGSDAVTLGVTLDKWLARRVVSPEVPVARAVLVEHEADEEAIGQLNFPVLVKPNDEGSSKGIRDESIARNWAMARERCRWLWTHYGCPALVEEYLPGTEITVAVAGNGSNVRVLGMMEIAPVESGQPFVYSLEVKRDYRRRVRYHIPPRLSEEARCNLAVRALTVYRLLRCRDVARLDFRMDHIGDPHFLECNPLPGLNPENSDLVILSRDSLPYQKLVQGILLDAGLRYGMQIP